MRLEDGRFTSCRLKKYEPSIRWRLPCGGASTPAGRSRSPRSQPGPEEHDWWKRVQPRFDDPIFDDQEYGVPIPPGTKAQDDAKHQTTAQEAEAVTSAPEASQVQTHSNNGAPTPVNKGAPPAVEARQKIHSGKFKKLSPGRSSIDLE